jgi:hypothetical protein
MARAFAVRRKPFSGEFEKLNTGAESSVPRVAAVVADSSG